MAQSRITKKGVTSKHKLKTTRIIQKYQMTKFALVFNYMFTVANVFYSFLYQKLISYCFQFFLPKSKTRFLVGSHKNSKSNILHGF